MGNDLEIWSFKLSELMEHIGEEEIIELRC